MKCCSYDHNGDGNCHIHASPGLPRILAGTTDADKVRWLSSRCAELEQDIEGHKARWHADAKQLAAQHDEIEQLKKGGADLVRGREPVRQCQAHYERTLQVADVFGMEELIRLGARPLDVKRRDPEPADATAERFAAMELT